MSTQQAVLYFRAPETGASFDLAPESALKHFRQKGLKTTFNWHEMLGDEHARAFTVAKMMDVDLLGDVRALLDQAIAEGKSVDWFRSNLIPQLQKAGWWGRVDTPIPGLGASAPVQLGSVARLNTIFRTNIQSAYSVGHWEQIVDNSALAPYLMYDAVDDNRTRPEHAELDGLTLKASDPFWQTHYPPNGWNCRCGVIQLDDAELHELGKRGPDKSPRKKTRQWTNPTTGQTSRVPVATDPGFDFNPGEHYLRHLVKLSDEKVQRLPKDMQASAERGLALAKLEAVARIETAQQAERKKTPLAQIVVGSEKEKAELIKQLQRSGLEAWPDGRKLADVIKVGGG